MVCVAPCKKTLDRNRSYFIGGSGITNSSPFILPARDKVTLHVKDGSSTSRGLGIALTCFGAITTALGGALYAVDAMSSFEEDRDKAGGKLIISGIGLAMLIPGVILWVTSGTHVSTSDGFDLATKTKKSPVGKLTLAPSGTITF